MAALSPGASSWLVGWVGLCQPPARSYMMPHAYFDALAARPDVFVVHSMRDQAALDASAVTPPSTIATYDPGADTYPLAQDACKVTLGRGGMQIGQQVRFPVLAPRPGRYIYTWDTWWGDGYRFINNNETGMIKQFMVASIREASEVYWGPGLIPHRVYAPGELGDTWAPFENNGGEVGPGVSQGALGRFAPQLVTYVVRENTWTRYWVLVDLRTEAELQGGAFDACSMWIADEGRDPVQMYDRIAYNAGTHPSGTTLTRFWLQYGQSRLRTSGPDEIVSYVRNLVVLATAEPVETFLARPLAATQEAGTVFSLTALKDEIVNDPVGLAYKNSPTANDWKGDQVIADLINNAAGTTPRTVNVTNVDTGDIRSDVEFAWFDGLVAAEQAWLEWLTANGVIKVNAHMLQQLAGIPTAAGSIWAVSDRTAANAAMAALMQFQGGRSEELWGEGTTISASQVGQAFNLI